MANLLNKGKARTTPKELASKLKTKKQKSKEQRHECQLKFKTRDIKTFHYPSGEVFVLMKRGNSMKAQAMDSQSGS